MKGNLRHLRCSEDTSTTFLAVRPKYISGAARRESCHPISSIQICVLGLSSGSWCVSSFRYGDLSTARLIEPIAVWNEPRELRFTVTETPPAPTEFNPLGAVIAPHLDGDFQSLGGQFLLKEVALSVPEIQATTWCATTWCTPTVASVWSWELLSVPILHLIHRRVLSHSKSDAEKS